MVSPEGGTNFNNDKPKEKLVEPSAVRSLVLKNIILCSPAQQFKIREIRNHESIREFMYTDHEIGCDEHSNWIAKLKNDKKNIVYAVLENDGEPIGVVSVNSIDYSNKKADWAFYIAPNERGGIGAVLEWFIIEHILNHLCIEKLNCEVLETNSAVVKLHKKFGFLEEGFRRENIIKRGQRIGVHFLGLTKSGWLTHRKNIHEKYEALFSKFPIKIED